MRTLIGILLLLVAGTSWADDEARRVLPLIDYIGGDYRNAVRAGKVIYLRRHYAAFLPSLSSVHLTAVKIFVFDKTLSLIARKSQ